MRTVITIQDILRSKAGHLNQHLKVEPRQKRKKFGNEIIEFDGQTFHSRKELNRYITNRMRQGEGEICDLQLQVEFILETDDKKICSYIADSTYKIVATGKSIVEDVKSPATRRLAPYRLKKKLMAAIYNIEIKEV